MKPKLISINWVDSAVTMGWFYEDYSDLNPSFITTIGFLVKETDDSISVSTSLSEHGRFVDILTIPKAVIKKRKFLKF